MKPTLGLLLVLLPALAMTGCNDARLVVEPGNQVVKYDVDGMT